MSAYINQMLGCLIIAAGIGGVVGWLLRHVSAGTTAEQLASVTAMMRLKEQMLEKARHQLREATAKLQAIESPGATLQEVQMEPAEQDLRREDDETLPTEKAA